MMLNFIHSAHLYSLRKLLNLRATTWTTSSVKYQLLWSCWNTTFLVP